MEEIWKPISNFEGLYEVSNLGNVRSVDRIKTQWNRYQNVKVKYKGQLLKKHKLRGYYAVNMWKNGKMYNKQIHRLVAQAFIPNQDNFPIVNHIDGNKTNNRVENLEWCSYSHNTKEAYRIGLKTISDKHKQATRKLGLQSGKKIAQKDLLGNVIKIFDSGRQASIELNINQGCISMCCNGKRKSVGGYKWEYIEAKEMS